MGDKLEDDDWIREDIEQNDQADWNAGDVDDEVDEEEDESHSDDETNEESDTVDEETKKEEKKLKRKQKFQELKAKKRQKLEEENEQSALSSANEIQFSSEEMLHLLHQHQPDSFHLSNFADNRFTEEVFFSPILPNATESVTKAACPFVRALSVGLPNYRKLLAEIPKSKEDYGSPLILIICSSANRASEIIKSISAKLIKCKIAKLFAKHFKVVEQIELLSKEYHPIAIGTPNRLNKLIEIGALQLNRLNIVLIDYTLDIKQFTVLTLPEVKEDTYQLIFGPVYKEKEHLKIALIKDNSNPCSSSTDIEVTKKKNPIFFQKRKKNQNNKRKGFSHKTVSK